MCERRGWRCPIVRYVMQVPLINYFKGIDAKGDYSDGNGKCATVQVLRKRMNMPRIGLTNKYF